VLAGLRISEALGLTWADVDFEQKRIDVRASST
jgi:integrase